MKKGIVERKLLIPLMASIIIALTVTPILASPVVNRVLPPAVMSGAEFDISIQATGYGICGQIVETLPQGFSYLGCDSSDIGVEQLGNIIKFSFIGDSASFTYRVKAPIAENVTVYTFQGVILDEDRIPHPIEDDEIIVTNEDNPPIAIGLASIYSNLVLVYSYCPGEGTGGWTVYNPRWADIHPSWNSLVTLQVGRGYWVKVNADCQLSYGNRNTPDNPLPPYNLREGWNLIGWIGY